MLGMEFVAKVLGFSEREAAFRSPLALISKIDEGLPVHVMERVAQLLAPNDNHFRSLLASDAICEGHYCEPSLSPAAGMRLVRVARVWSIAVDAWATEDEARAFLFRPHPMLEDQRPIDLLLKNEIGAALVLQILGNLNYGSAA